MLERFSISEHLLQPARHIISPNQSDREPAVEISLLVIHNISLPPGKFGAGYVDDLFCNCLNPAVHPFFAEIADLRVSAHLLIERDGTVTQYVPFDCKAWHAGQSCFDGREHCNDYSIGIELEGTDHCVFTEIQYQRLTAITQVILQHYPSITAQRIVGHSDIAPGRKTDPGPCFDWQRYLISLSDKVPANNAR